MEALSRYLDQATVAFFSWNAGPTFKLCKMCQDVLISKVSVQPIYGMSRRESKAIGVYKSGQKFLLVLRKTKAQLLEQRKTIDDRLEKEKEWKLKTGEKWEDDKNTIAKMEENVKEIIILTIIGWFCTICVMQ